MKGTDEVGALIFGYRRQVVLPGVRIHGTGTLLVKPAYLSGAKQKDTSEYQLGYSLGVFLCIGKTERAAPGSAKDQPSVDTQFFAQLFHVRNQMPCRIGLQGGMRG